MKKNNKENIYKGIIVVLLLVIVFGGSYFASELKNNCSGSTKAEAKELTQISYADYKNLKKGKDLSVIYVARPTCGYCQKQEPIVKSIKGEYDVEFYYFNTDEVSQGDLEEFIKSYDVFKGGENFGTPTFLLVQKGKIVDSLIGYNEKDSLVSFLKDHKIIEE